MNNDKSNNTMTKKVSFDEALDKAGFGLYSYLITGLTGICIISFACIGYGNTFLVPTSACELGTTVNQQGILAAGPVVGLIIGAFYWGYLADTRGRRVMLLVCLIGSVIFNLIATLSVNWIMLLIFQFIASIFASGLYSIAMSLLSESVPASKKNLVVLLVSSIFLLSQGFMALLALPIIPLRFSYHISTIGIYWNSWRLLMFVFCLPSVFTAVCVYFMQESPKFVYVMGDEKRTLKILRAIHTINNWTSKKELQVQWLLMENTEVSEVKSSVKEQIAPLFKAPYLKYTIITTVLNLSEQIGSFMVWLPTIANQFVRIIQSGESTNLTMCGILDMESAPADVSTPKTTMAIAFALTCSRVGTFASIQVLNLLLTNYCEVGFYLFASSAIVAMFLPDDRKLHSSDKNSTASRTDKEDPIQETSRC